MNPILVEVYRAGVLESFHRGVICMVDSDNHIIYSEGNVHQVCYPRSALKYFQHIPLIESGAFEHFGFTLQELAVMCGSHNGEAAHTETVMGILAKIGLDVSFLYCGPQYPTLKKDIAELYKQNQAPQHIHNNCSGKHAGFLAMSVYMGADPKTYWKSDHPLQKQIKKVVSEMHEYSEADMITAFDGCSAPIFSIPVINQAIAYKNLTLTNTGNAKREQACKLIIEAVSTHPLMVAGTRRYCTDMMKICGHQVIGKTGAEGIFSLAFLNEQIGCTIKIDDGKMLPQYHVAQKLIRQSRLFSDEQLLPLQTYEESILKNFNGLETGVMKVADHILNNSPLFSN
jgi:L-asparaginase II